VFWRLLVKTPAAFRLLMGSGEGSGVTRWLEYSHPRFVRIVEVWEAKSPADLSAKELLAGARELLDAGTEYYTSVQTIIPLTYVSEALFTTFYNRLVRREGDPPAQTFVLGFDSMPIQAEKSLYDLGTWSREHPDLARALVGTPSEQILDLLGAEGE
jgi:rifampicin phosphotransferase